MWKCHLIITSPTTSPSARRRQGCRLLVPGLVVGDHYYNFIFLVDPILPLPQCHVDGHTATLFCHPQYLYGQSRRSLPPQPRYLENQTVRNDVNRALSSDTLTFFSAGPLFFSLRTVMVPSVAVNVRSSSPRLLSMPSRMTERHRTTSSYSGNCFACSVIRINNSAGCCLVFFLYTRFSFWSKSFIFVMVAMHGDRSKPFGNDESS